ncbi:unnamed protein product [Caenorhabditis nigoni]
MIDSRLAFASGKMLDESMDIYQAYFNVKKESNIGTEKQKKDISLLSFWMVVQHPKKQDFYTFSNLKLYS